MTTIQTNGINTLSLALNASEDQSKAAEAATPSVTIETFTPARAAEWLKKYNTANYRSIKPPLVKKYAESMRRGDWPLGVDGLKRGVDGRLMDGQNRLAACVLADVPFTTYVFWGVPVEAELHMDTGKPRTFAEYLKYHGEKNATALATTLNILHCMLNGRPQDLVNKTGKTPWSDLLEVLAENPKIQDAVSWASSARKHIPSISHAYLAASRYLFARVEDSDPVSLAADLDWFFARLSDGTELAATDPVHHLRELLARHHRAPANHKPHQTTLFAYMIKAWNATRAGDTMQRLTYRPGGATREQFPMPR